jgi:hypothetical protein
MNIRIANAGDQHLSALVGQLGTTKNSKELRSGLNETGVQELYVKTKISTGMFAGKEKNIERATSQQNARVDIMKALYNEFPQAVADKVLTNMKSFFSSKGEVTVADARAILATANAIDARRAEVGIVDNLLDPQNHPQVAALFSTFLTTEYSHENYDFIQGLKEYKAIPADVHPATFKKAKADEIAARFIETGAAQEVNITNSERNDIVVKLLTFNTLPAAEQNAFFDKAEFNICNLAKNDSMPRFLKTPAALNYINNG